MLAAGLKLLNPFVIVIPGIIAFNLFSGEMEANAGNVMAVYEQAATTPHQGDTIFKLDSRWAMAHPEKAAEVDSFNASVTDRVGEDMVKIVELNQYKYDSALGLLITKLIPKNVGILGFVIAALMGAIVSSLAAVLNAASTLLTMDVYQRYIRPDASQHKLVLMGRICIGAFVIIGCMVSPYWRITVRSLNLFKNFKDMFRLGLLRYSSMV